MSKKVGILVTACSTPHVPSPALPPPKSKSHQFLLPEDNSHPITIVKSKSDYKTSKRVIQPLIEPLEEVYSESKTVIKVLRRRENLEFSVGFR